jgi:hypothetical protein
MGRPLELEEAFGGCRVRTIGRPGQTPVDSTGAVVNRSSAPFQRQSGRCRHPCPGFG